MKVWLFSKDKFEPKRVEFNVSEIWLCDEMFNDMNLDEVSIKIDEVDEGLCIVSSKSVIQNLSRLRDMV